MSFFHGQYLSSLPAALLFFLPPVKKRVTPDVRQNLHIYWAEPDSMQISVKSFPITFPAESGRVPLIHRFVSEKWPQTRGVAYGMPGSSLFKTPMRFLSNVHRAHEFYQKLAAFEQPTDVSSGVSGSFQTIGIKNYKILYLQLMRTLEYVSANALSIYDSRPDF